MSSTEERDGDTQPELDRIVHGPARLKILARTIPFKSPFTRVIPALSIATSVPVPIAIPT